ncbi:MAG TPA: sugar-binding protein [Victivallales bacterium]|nr:sugar-binding protein [Victivallales bacterium]HPO90643.1 sugar-binding protein [Victivallales bacterium]HRU00310.1 sugar-binding protein [Victivallales bacterium]
MKIVKMLFSFAFLWAINLRGDNQISETVTTKLNDWCTVTCPKIMQIGQTISVKVELKGVNAPTTISTHLHYKKTGGEYGGMFAYAPPQQVKEANGTFTFKFKIGVKPDLESAHPMIFLSPTGNWNDKTANVLGPDIPLSNVNSDGSSSKELISKLSSIQFKKSWIYADTCPEATFFDGDEWTVKIEYYLDPSEDTGSTKIKFMGLGPWIDNPDGIYQQKRMHLSYPGLSFIENAKPGKNIIERKLKLTKPYEYNSILCITKFSNAEIGDWPWEIRTSGPHFKVREKFYELTTDLPGNLFTYNEPVQVNIITKVSDNVEKKISWKLTDFTGTELSSGVVKVNPTKPEQKFPILIKTERRGVFLFETQADDWGKRKIYFARIPDVKAITKGKETKFGMTGGGTKEVAEANAKLGFTSSRIFCSLKNIAPASGDFRTEGYDRAIENLNANGIRPWICLTSMPPWIQKGKACDQGYFPIPFDDTAWQLTVKSLSEKWKGKISGFEWLNEIVPGDKCENPVTEYLRFCKIGTETSKSIDPSFKNLLAGGLWPRNYRVALLNEGIGKYIDILSVHYGNGQSIIEAKEDLEVYGLKNIHVWDNETARGLSTWNVPPIEVIKPDYQCRWILKNWTDELMAGAERIVYFGGSPEPTGNWSNFMGNMEPRPVAATIAVFISKLHNANPLGTFFLGEQNAKFQLFEKDKKPVLVASIDSNEGGENKQNNWYSPENPLTEVLFVPGSDIVITDYQGNEEKIKTENKIAKVNVGTRPIFIENGNLETIKTYLVPSVETTGRLSRPFSTATFIKGKSAQLNVLLDNICTSTLSGKISVVVPDGWQKQEELDFSVNSGEKSYLKINLKLPENINDGTYPLKVIFAYSKQDLPVVEKKVNISIVSPEMLGNLIKNSGFEEPAEPGESATFWGGNAKRVEAPSNVPGLGKYSIKFSAGNSWQHYAQTVNNAPAGQVFLYSAWIFNKNMRAGSNIGLLMQDGTQKTLTIPHVFDAGENSPGWKLYSCHIDGGINLKSISAVPVVNGKGEAFFDNIRLTVYEGSDYTAECHKIKKTITVDGKLSDWEKKCPIPLLADNQIMKIDKNYDWTPDNLSGAAYFSWDDKNLYVALEIKDNIHISTKTAEKTVEDDSVVLGILPSKDAQENKAFCYYISSAVPGGGSGKFTLYRPIDRSAGLPAEHLARDSSVYELAINSSNGFTIYELRMPFSDMGGILPTIGAKIALSICVNDNDGKGRQAIMKWGEGIFPAWSPRHFGILTFVE